MEREFLPLFKVISTHGLKGDLKVTLLSTNEELTESLRELFLLKPELRSFSVREIKKGPGHLVYILSLEGVSFEEAKSLVGSVFYIRLSDLPQLEEGEFYYHQLEGMFIVDEEGYERGKVIGVIPMGDYELLAVRTEKGKEVYIPLVDEYIEEIDFERGIIRVKSVEDLIAVQV